MQFFKPNRWFEHLINVNEADRKFFWKPKMAEKVFEFDETIEEYSEKKVNEMIQESGNLWWTKREYSLIWNKVKTLEMREEDKRIIQW